ncbi:hypothetical protein [Oscillatoria salina]|nr:hypothetical protein [Oscillatoria salina]MBZ8181565.1 hypothetical protein [Oscillatoria salina IIICB1]NET89542.1 hypothetical protein [Kamptonema sp. SIO1D9]
MVMFGGAAIAHGGLYTYAVCLSFFDKFRDRRQVWESFAVAMLPLQFEK